jgi:hypothetical protein
MSLNGLYTARSGIAKVSVIQNLRISSQMRPAPNAPPRAEVMVGPGTTVPSVAFQGILPFLGHSAHTRLYNELKSVAVSYLQ